MPCRHIPIYRLSAPSDLYALCPLNEDAYELIIRLFGDKDGEVDAAVRQLEIKDLYESQPDENHPHRGEFTYKEGLLYEILEKSNVNTFQELQEIEQEINEKSQFYGVDIPSKITSVLQEARAILEKQANQERVRQEEKKQREREEQERLKQEEERKQREREEQKRLAEEAEKRKQEEAARLAEENERKRLEAEKIRKLREEQERIKQEEERKQREREEQERIRREAEQKRLAEEEKKRKSEALPITNKSKLAALILSIIFGWLGIDRFYLGHIITGIIKLITGGGFGIWWIIDVILIVSGILTPKDGRYKT